MTLKNGNTHSTTAAGEPRRTEGVDVALNKTVLLEENTITVSVIDKLKARSLRAIRRSGSRKKRGRFSHAVAVDIPPRRSKRVVHFAEKEVEHSPTEFARSHAFRRSSKLRQPVRRISRPKGSPPPAQLAKIHQIAERLLSQPNFDQTSDGESADEVEEDPLPPIPLPPILLQNLRSEASSTSESSDDENAYTVLPAITVTTTATASTELEDAKERHGVADSPLARREIESSRRASLQRKLIRRRSSYRASVRRASTRRLSVRRTSVRRSSNVTRRRSCRSIVKTTVVRQRSSAIPGYVYRRSSVVARSSYESNQLQYRKKRRKRQYRRPRKIVVIGDMCSGKSSLISAYCRDKFSEMYVPTILTSCMTDAEVMGEKIELVVVEVAGRIDYAKIRRCAYHRMDLVILCYSADSPASLQAIKDSLLPELKKVAPKVPYILVGTKKDIREDRVCEVELGHSQKKVNDSTIDDKSNSLRHDDLFTDNIVTRRQGLEIAETIGAQDFLECSAMYRDGTRDVFETAAKIALKRSPRRKKKHTSRADTCTIL